MTTTAVHDEIRDEARTGAAPAKPRRRRSPWRALRTAVVLLALIAGAVFGGRYIVQDRLAEQAYVDIGSAVLTAEAIPVGSTSAGVVTELLVAEQDEVREGEVLARVRLTANPAEGPAPVEVLRAPADGRVSATNVEIGGVARAGEPVVTLYDQSELTFQAQVPAEQLPELRLGMIAYLTGPSLDEPITATVERVQPRMLTDAAAPADRLTVVLEPRAEDAARVRTLLPGLPFQATVDTKSATDTTPAVNTA